MSLIIKHLHVNIGGDPGKSLRRRSQKAPEKKILRDVSLHVADRERVGLVGASGSGKSMLAMSVMGLLPRTVHVSGSAVLDGTELIGGTPQDLADIRGRAVGFIFQDPGTTLNPVVPVGKQIEQPLRRHYDLSKEDRRERVSAMLEKVGLGASVASAYPHELSGGQQQRVGIACALITSPKLIIADEPTTALDAMTQLQIVELLVQLVDGAGASLLFITHDFSVLARVAQRSYVLESGEIVEEGDTAGLLANPSSQAGDRLVTAAKELTFARKESR
ncbi:MAG: ABC transporter ATP-binding protein [Bifidobacteriaceae bacterium]|jgi:peptide/nickel transport system ATP-binding protein|nr:ABC transporter ATP-binding protein [Bifidobacteriaceae bacterium]MCI1978423.1 ABC transporter ATP-binding protein [Bifidobacteriaceae bacterium]